MNSKNITWSKTELLVVLCTLIAIWTSAFFNFRISQIKARDIQRKNDLKHIRAALEEYRKIGNVYPLSESNGRIIACGTSEDVICDWGTGVIYNTKKSPPQPIIDPLPRDPQSGSHGRLYIYESNSKHFKLYASLEQKDEIEYNAQLEKLNKKCGSEICNFGITSSNDIDLYGSF